MNRPTLYLFMIMFLTPFCYGSVSTTLSVPAPTPPGPVQIKPKPAPAHPIVVECPITIQVGPLFAPAGWTSLESFPRQRQGISIDEQKRQIVCFYGTPGDTNFIASYYITRSIPAGYQCGKFAGILFSVNCEVKKPGSR